MPPTNSRSKHQSKLSSDTETEDYVRKRDRNNVAVKKSRDKSRLSAKETTEKMSRLRKENNDLEARMVVLSKELQHLKSVFLNQAAGIETNDEENKRGTTTEVVKKDHGYSAESKSSCRP